MYGLGRKRLYQIGNADDVYFVVPRLELNYEIQPTKQLKLDDSFLYNGFSRLNGQEKDIYASYQFNLSFKITERHLKKNPKVFNLNFLNRLSDHNVVPLFFYEYDNDKNLTWYYSYGFISTPPKQIISENDTSGGIDTENMEVSLGITMMPYYWDCNTEIKYLNTDTATTTTVNWGSTTWGGSVWQPNNSQYALISSLSIDNKTNYFTANVPKFPVWLQDRFIKRELLTPSSYLLNQTLSDTNPTDVYTSNALQYTTTDNLIYRLEITPLDYNQSITIENLSNDSGIKITWVDLTANANSLVYNSYKGKFYDLITNLEIPLSKINYEVLRNRNLYFSAMEYNRSPNTHPFNTTELMRLQRTSGTNSTIKIDVLKSFR